MELRPKNYHIKPINFSARNSVLMVATVRTANKCAGQLRFHNIGGSGPNMIFTFPDVRTGPGVIRLTVGVRVPRAGEDHCALSEPAPDLSCTARTVL